MTCNHVINDMLFRCDRCGMDKNDIANEARENRMDAYFRYGVSTQGETRMTTDEAAGRMVHTPTEAPGVLEAPGVRRLRMLLDARDAEIERMTAERDELLCLLRDIVFRNRDGTIEVYCIECIDLLSEHPSLEKWIPAR